MDLLQAIDMTRKADGMTQQERAQLQQERLRKLVAYARDNSPYFAQRYASLPEKFSLQDLPVTTKTDMTQNFDVWMTDRGITREKVLQFVANRENVGKPLDGKYFIYATSGSTGTPCFIPYDASADSVFSALGLLRAFARTADRRAFLKTKGKTLYLFADDQFCISTATIHHVLRDNPQKANTLTTFDARNPMPQIVEKLNDFQPDMLLSYPNTLEVLMDELEAGRLKIHPTLVITGGEGLTEPARERFAKAFGCHVQATYACTEGGYMACECDRQHFHVNDDWIILEAVDENNQPVPYGQESHKVLMTNLTNYVCPLIRFEITDRIVMHDESCPCGNSRPWLEIEGRTDDVLSFDGGKRIAPLVLYALLDEMSALKRFQLVQKSTNRLDVRLSTLVPKEAAFQPVWKALNDFFVKNDIHVEIVLSQEEPCADPVSGKYKHVIGMKR